MVMNRKEASFVLQDKSNFARVNFNNSRSELEMSLTKCRTCGDGIFVPHSRNIFSSEHENILKKIENLTGLVFDNKKDLPQHICSCCLLDLEHATLFRERCIKAQRNFGTGAKSDPDEIEIEFDENDLDNQDERQNEDDSDEPITSELDDVEAESPTQSQVSVATKYPRVMLKRLPSSVIKKSRPNPTIRSTYKRKRKRVVNLEKRYTCEYCGWSFRDSSNLKYHKMTHLEKEITCEECGRKFYTPHNLRLHVRVIHRMEKPFKCKYCGEGFGNSPSRCRHERTMHADELPFQCKICEHRFISKIGLDRHLEKHKQGKLKAERFYCSTCEKEFKDKRVLTRHYETSFHKKRLSNYLDLGCEGDRVSVETNDEEFDLVENLMQGKHND